MNKPIDVLMAPEADLPIDANPAAFVAASGDGVVVPDAQLLFTADFVRSGHDLKLIGNDGAEVVIPEYFSNAIAPALTAPNGVICTQNRHLGKSPFSIASNRSRVDQSGSLPAISMACSRLKFLMPCLVLK